MKKRTKGLVTLVIAAFSTVVLAQTFTTFPYVRVQNQLDLQGTVSANGSTGTSGQVLTSNGASDVTWSTLPPDGVTSITGASGVTASPNPIISTGTLSVDQAFSPTWTGQHVFGLAPISQGTGPRYDLLETDGTANNQRWQFAAQDEQLRLRVANDALSVVTNFLTVDRTGTTIDAMALSATALTWNGSSMVNLASSPTWTGTHTFANSSVGFWVQSTAPGFRMEDVDAAVDEKQWLFDINAGDFRLTTRTDAGAFGALPLQINRTGTAIDSIQLASTALTWNGNAICANGGTCRFADGTAGAPSMAFASDTDTGIYKFAANTIGVSAAGQAVANWTEFGLNMTGSGAFLDFMTVNPTAYIEWKDDTGATIRSRVGEVAGTMFVDKLTTGGLQLQTSNGTISLGPGGGNIISLAGPTQFTSTMRGAAGTAGAPAFSFSSDTNDGIFDSGADQVAIATGGTQRFTVNAAGEIGLGSGNSVGTAGQVLTSGGTAATPTWTTPIEVTSGSFTVNYDDACTTTPAVTFKYLKVGSMVTLSWNSPGSCTSDSVNFLGTAADVPAALRPTTTQFSMALKTIDNGVIADAVLSIGSSGTVTVYFCPGAGGSPLSGAACAFNAWTNSGTKRNPLSGTMTYSVGH